MQDTNNEREIFEDTIWIYRFLVRGRLAAFVGQRGGMSERQIDVVVGRRWSAAGGRDLRVRTRIDTLRRGRGRGCTRDVTYRAQGHLLPHS